MPLLASAACVAALPAAVIVFLDAWQTEEIVAVFNDPSPTARGDILDRYFDTPPTKLSTTAAAALAELALEAARGETQSGMRKLYLGQAAALVQHIHTVRPDWSIGNILIARLQIAQTGKLTPVAIRAFVASYRSGLFLRREAKWRIAFAILCWRSLDMQTRNAVIDEAVWIVQFDGSQRGEIESLLGDSPAAVSFQLKLARPRSL